MEAKEIPFEEFKEKMDRNETLFLLDVRKKEDFEKHHILGNSQLTVQNASYPAMLEENKDLEPKQAVLRFIDRHLKESLPSNQAIYVVCNRGRSSLIVQDALQEKGYRAVSLQGGMQGWSQLYQKKEAVNSPQLEIVQIIRPARGCLSYLIAVNQQALIIDPSRHLQVYNELLEEKRLKLKLIIDTHAHADHISGAKALAHEHQAAYYLHPYDGIHPMDLLPATFSFYYAEAKERDFEGISLKIFHIPGHTLGNLALLLDEKYLFGGDSIFLESIARPDLGGHAETWTELHYHSLKTLLELPDNIEVFPGHFALNEQMNPQQIYSATMRELKQKNEGVKMVFKPYEEFKTYILEHLPVFPSEYVDIKRINLGLLTVNDLQANTYESGQNICAISGKKV